MTVVPTDIEDMARAIAVRSGTTLEQVLRRAVEMEAHLAGIAVPSETASAKPANLVAARDIAERVAALPLLDARSPVEILEEAWAEMDDRRR